MPHVDVVTPSLSARASLLAECRESVRRQTHKDLNHRIGIDYDGIGPGFVRNRLVNESAADWIVFLDDDDLLDDRYVEWLLKIAEAGADIVYAPCRYPPGAPWRPPIGRFDPDRLRSANYIPVTVLMRRELFQKVRGFQVTAPYEDWRLWLELLRRGPELNVRWGYFPHVCWTYRLHGNAWSPLR
jgi:glycosyltransferase involved in cell wall biosynthesis